MLDRSITALKLAFAVRGKRSQIILALKRSPLDRIFLLVSSLLAAYQVTFGIDGLAIIPVIAYTIGFGVLLVAGLLLIILGFEVLEGPVVVVVTTLIPLSLATGLVWEYLASYRVLYLVFAILGFIVVTITRIIPISGKLPAILLAGIHGIAGMTIFLLPIVWSLQGRAPTGFSLVGIGGMLIGIGGLLLSFLKAGNPILSKEDILKILPGLLLVMTVCFVAGFWYR